MKVLTVLLLTTSATFAQLPPPPDGTYTNNPPPLVTYTNTPRPVEHGAIHTTTTNTIEWWNLNFHLFDVDHRSSLTEGSWTNIGDGYISYEHDYPEGFYRVVDSGDLVIDPLPDLDVLEPTNGYPFAEYTPPVTDTQSDAMIAEWVRSADKDRTIVFASDEDIESFIFCGTIINTNSPTTYVTYDVGYGHTTSPADGFKMMWPITSTATGTPVRLNNTIAWWLGPDLCDTNEQFNIYGNNLDESGTTYAYIDGYGWITNVWGNNQKATFNVPDDLTNGTYTVYAHNGLGGKYGWGEGHSLTIASLVDYTVNSEINVSSNNFSDLLTKIDTAPANSIVNVPAGTYQFTTEIHAAMVNDNIWIKGAGTNQTIFIPASSFNGAGREGHELLMDLGSTYASHTDFVVNGWKITGITFDRGSGTPMPYGLLRVRGSNNRITDCEFLDDDLPDQTVGGKVIAVFSGEEGGPCIVEDCRFVQVNCVEVSSYVQARRNKHYGSNDMLGAILQINGCHDTDISDCFAAAEDQSELDKSCQGRFFVMQNQRGWHFYFGSNTTENFKPHPDSVKAVNDGNQNTGEQVLFENTAPLGVFSVVSATSNTIECAEFSDVLSSYYGMVTVVEGLGAGQTRPLGSFSGSDTVSILEPWTITPDTTSKICPHYSGWRGAIVANYLDGIANNQNTASAAVSLYGGPSEVIIADNTSNEVEDGYIVWAYTCEKPQWARSKWAGDEDHPNYAFFNVFENNKNLDPRDHSGDGGGYGYYVNVVNGSKDSYFTPTHAIIGNIFRDNTVSNATLALSVQGSETTFDSTMTVFEFNTGSASNAWSATDGLHTVTNNNGFIILE